jgi:Zn-finger nucleic acid-binding protein
MCEHCPNCGFDLSESDALDLQRAGELVSCPDCEGNNLNCERCDGSGEVTAEDALGLNL